MYIHVASYTNQWCGKRGTFAHRKQSKTWSRWNSLGMRLITASPLPTSGQKYFSWILVWVLSLTSRFVMLECDLATNAHSCIWTIRTGHLGYSPVYTYLKQVTLNWIRIQIRSVHTCNFWAMNLLSQLVLQWLWSKLFHCILSIYRYLILGYPMQVLGPLNGSSQLNDCMWCLQYGWAFPIIIVLVQLWWGL